MVSPNVITNMCNYKTALVLGFENFTKLGIPHMFK